MYDWEYSIIEEFKKLHLKKDLLEKEEKAYIEGSLIIRIKNNGKKKEFYHESYINGKRVQKYLSLKKDKAIIDALQKKRNELPPIVAELRKIKITHKKLLPVAKKVLSEITVPQRNYPPVFSENHKYPESLKYLTARGEMVRSMSEKIIADMLFKYNIDYRYEKVLKSEDTVLYPDFTIISPLNNQVYTWNT